MASQAKTKRESLSDVSAVNTHFTEELAQSFANKAGLPFNSTLLGDLNLAADDYRFGKHAIASSMSLGKQKEIFEQLNKACERFLQLLSILSPSAEVSLVLATDRVVGPHLGDLLGRLKVDVHRLSTLAQAIQEFQLTNKGGRPSSVLRFCIYRLCTAYSRATGKLPSYSKETKSPFVTFVSAFFKCIDPSFLEGRSDHALTQLVARELKRIGWTKKAMEGNLEQN